MDLGSEKQKDKHLNSRFPLLLCLSSIFCPLICFPRGTTGLADGLSFALRLVCWLPRLCPAWGSPDLFPQRPPCSPLFPTLQPRHAVSLPWFFACLMSVSMLSSQLFCPHAWRVTGIPTTEFQRLGRPARDGKVSLGAFWLPLLATEG